MTDDKKRVRNWLIKAVLIIIAGLFLIGYLLPLLISGGTFSILIGIGCGLLFLIALVFEGFELYAELTEIIGNKKQ